MHTLADRLEHLDVYRGRAPVVAVVLILIFADDAVGTLERGKRERRLFRDAGDDGAGVEREDARVRVDLVRVEHLRVRSRFQHWRGQFGERREGVFVWAVEAV